MHLLQACINQQCTGASHIQDKMEQSIHIWFVYYLNILVGLLYSKVLGVKYEILLCMALHN